MHEPLEGQIDQRNIYGWPRNELQDRWAWFHVMEGLSAHAAALKAGYTPETAKAKSHRLTSKLRPYLEHLQQRKNAAAEQQFEVTVERLLREATAIALSDAVSYVRRVLIGGVERWVGKPPDALTEMQRIAVRSWSQHQIKTDDGIVIDYRYRLHEKQASIEFVGKHLGMLSEKLMLLRQTRRMQDAAADYSNVPNEVLMQALALLEGWGVEAAGGQSSDCAEPFVRAEGRKLLMSRRIVCAANAEETELA